VKRRKTNETATSHNANEVSSCQKSNAVDQTCSTRVRTQVHFCWTWTRTWQFFQQVLLQVHFTKCTCGEGVSVTGVLYYCTLQLAIQALRVGLHPEQCFIPIATQQCTIPVNDSATCGCLLGPYGCGVGAHYVTTSNTPPIHRLLCLCNLSLTLADVNLQFIPGARRCHKRTN